MIHRAQFEQWVPAPIEQVFRFFGTPRNLPRLMPAWMQVRLEDVHIVPVESSDAKAPLANAGSVLRASYRAVPLLPFRLLSEAKITRFQMNEYFEDIQTKGPFKSWHHRHEFARDVRAGVDGTLVKDQVEYDPGFGTLGILGNALFVAPQLRRTFYHRQLALDDIIYFGRLTNPE